MALNRHRPAKKDYLNYVCPYCFQQLNRCTCELYPPWELIFIDQNMQGIIRLLNEKGYKTASCCESHYNGNINIYVSFHLDYELFTTAEYQPPYPFEYHNKKDNVIEYIIRATTEEEFEKEKLHCLSELITWVSKLPTVDYKTSIT